MHSPDDEQRGVFANVAVADGISRDRLISKLRIAVGVVRKGLHGLPRLHHSTVGCTSVLPERDLRASVLQVVYSVRSERYRLLFRWLVGLNVGNPVWDYLTCSFSQGRLFDKEIAQGFFEHPALLARINDLVSDENRSTVGTLLDPWVPHKKPRLKDPDAADDGGCDLRGQRRSGGTHVSTTRANAYLVRQGKEAELRCLANASIENRHGLFAGIDVRHATGAGEPDEALALVDTHAPHASTFGADMELTGGVCLQVGQCMRLVGENRGKRGDRRENVYLDKRVNTRPPQGENAAFPNDVPAFQYL